MTLLWATLVILAAQDAAQGQGVALAVLQPTKPITFAVRVTPVERAGGVIEIASLRSGPTRTRIELPSGEWDVVVESPGYWAPEARVTVNDRVYQDVGIRMWELGLVRFETSLVVSAAEVAFSGAGSAEVPRGRSACSMSQKHWECKVPVGVLNTKILFNRASRVAPVYRFSLPVKQGAPLSLGRLKLTEGGSVSGFVQDSVLTSDPPSSRSFVELRTQAGRSILGAIPRASSDDLKKPHGALLETINPLRVSLDDRGFFQIVGVQPGDYRLHAENSGRTVSALVAVAEGKEKRLAEPLVLRKPTPLIVVVEPGAPPDDDAWELRIRDLLSQGAESVGRRTKDGVAQFESIGVGTTQGVEVWAGGQKWFSTSISVEEQPGPLHLKIPVTRIRGKVSLGGDELKASLTFGGRNGPSQIRMESDEGGAFSGFLPRPGLWRIFIEAPEKSVARTLNRVGVIETAEGEAELKINLPDVVVKGVVVDADGVAQANALVNALPADISTDLTVQIYSMTDGTFKLRGLPAGKVSLTASSRKGDRSAPVVVSLTEGGMPDIRLVVEALSERRVIVSGPDGAPLPGSLMMNEPAGQPRLGRGLRATDQSGTLRIRTAKDELAHDFLFWADGRSLDFGRFHWPGEAGDALSLTVANVGGDIEIENARATTDPLATILLRNGAAEEVRGLSSVIARRFGTPPSTGDNLVLRQLAPGEYRLCQMNRLAYALGQGPSPAECEILLLESGQQALVRAR